MSAENSTRETQPPKTMTLSDLEMRDARGPVSNTGTAVFVSGKGRPRVKGGGRQRAPILGVPLHARTL